MRAQADPRPPTEGNESAWLLMLGPLQPPALRVEVIARPECFSIADLSPQWSLSADLITTPEGIPDQNIGASVRGLRCSSDSVQQEGSAMQKVRALPWLLFAVWLFMVTLALITVILSGTPPVDFASYQSAAEAIVRGESPYGTPEQSRQIWRAIHQFEQDLLAGRPQEPTAPLQGPYIYLPTLALLIAQLRLDPLVFVGLLLLAVFSFGWLWLRSTGGSG